LIMVLTMTAATTWKTIRHSSSKKEKNFRAVKCHLTSYKETITPKPPPPPPEYIIEYGAVAGSCCCTGIPPVDIIQEEIEKVELEALPVPCYTNAYMNREWMSYLEKFINTDSIDHNQAPYNNYSIFFQYQVLPDGSVANFQMDDDAFGAEKLLRKAIEESPLKWTPAIVDGQPVPSTIQQKIVFYAWPHKPVLLEYPQFLRFDNWL
jgi:hypothetical protein